MLYNKPCSVYTVKLTKLVRVGFSEYVDENFIILYLFIIFLKKEMSEAITDAD